jgi:hypothetical protein
MPARLKELIKRPPSWQSIKAFKEQMQISSATTKDTEDKRLKKSSEDNFFYQTSKQNMDLPTSQFQNNYFL